MSIDITKSELLIHERREHLEMMDDYGNKHHVYIGVLGSGAQTRDSVIAAHVSLMQSNQDAMEAYAKAHGHDISAQKAAGIAKKHAILNPNPTAAQAATSAPAAPSAPATTIPAATPIAGTK